LVTGRVLPFRSRRIEISDGSVAAARVLSLSFDERVARSAELELDEPETLLALCGSLRERLEQDPALILSEADFLFRFLESPKRPIGLFDEREYFLGETALIAGTASRILGRAEDTRRWLDRAESRFRLTVNAVVEAARVSYERLVLLLQGRQFETVLELLPPLTECFERQEMPREALKSRFLEAIAYKEAGNLNEALSRFNEIAPECEARDPKLLASAYTNLIQLHSELGHEESVLELSRKAIPLLQAIGNRVDEVRIQWGVANLFRSQGRLPDSIRAFQSCDEKFVALEMFPDAAAIRLIIGDLLLDVGQEAAARAAILSALPTIEEYQMAPEGMAALALLQESIRQQRVNRQALRELHGYFEQVTP
jgi:tetratricopeptide (TPR) repeat protein